MKKRDWNFVLNDWIMPGRDFQVFRLNDSKAALAVINSGKAYFESRPRAAIRGFVLKGMVKHAELRKICLSFAS
jgi:hypothetical protein